MLPEVSFNQFGITEFQEHFALFNEILLKEFRNLYPDLPDNSLDYLKKMSEYNVPHGKLNRGMMVIEALSEFRSDGKINKEELMKASCLGWCIEWLQAFFLVADDVMDSSLSRRGQPCWFRQPDVGLAAVNDALILKSSINLLLKSQFKSSEVCGKDVYFKLSELFREVELSTEMGQMLDMTRFDFQDKNLMNRYKLITKYKTSIYSFYFPFACAFILANNSVKDVDMENEKDILLEIGHLFQVQDDILDAFGDPEVTGKIGRDIEEGKCTWLLCKCLSLPHLTESDRNILMESRDSSVVKGVYEKHQILNHFEMFHLELKNRIEKSIATLSRPSSSRILLKYLNKIVKRIK